MTNDLLIFGFGLTEKSYVRIPENELIDKIEKIVFGDMHMVFLYSKK